MEEERPQEESLALLTAANVFPGACWEAELKGPTAPLPRSKRCSPVPCPAFLCQSGRQGACGMEGGAGPRGASSKHGPLCSKDARARSLGPGASLSHSFPPQLGIRAVLQPAIIGNGGEHSASPAPPQCTWCAHTCARHWGTECLRGR